jgi:hypothetical protein
MSMIRYGRRLAAVVSASLLLLAMVGPTATDAKPPSWSHSDAHVCGPAKAGDATCMSVARTFYRDGKKVSAPTLGVLAADASAADQVTWFHGTDLRTAYGITAQGDPSRVVAIVDAYDNPDAFANLTRFRSDQNLPVIQSCALATLTALTSSASNPCFTKTNQSGGTSLPAANANWATEMDLDLQAASVVCPMCSILVVEASSSTLLNLNSAATTAGNQAHVLAISNSYGGGDTYGSILTGYDNAAKKGIAVTASTGDSGFATSFPASATNVIAVGGTTVTVNDSGVRTTEAVWPGAGSGCSSYNAAPSWQVISGNPCAGKKATADLSADADPNSGLAVFTTYSGIHGYWIFGGTSLSSPLIAAQYTEQGGYGPSNLAGKYAWASTTAYFDVTSGNNGTTCSPSVLCTAGTGWDGPTGLGSISIAPPAPPVLTSVAVSPASASVGFGGQKQFSATALDQYGQPLSSQPAFTWGVSGAGNGVDSSGLVTAGSTAGTFIVTATGGGVPGTASLTVVAPNFTISVSPGSQSVHRGSTATYTVTITPSNGFSAPVTLTVSGNPSGTTPSWSVNPTTSTSTLRIPILSTTSRQTYTLTITGNGGGKQNSTTAKLTVTR